MTKPRVQWTTGGLRELGTFTTPGPERSEGPDAFGFEISDLRF